MLHIGIKADFSFIVILIHIIYEFEKKIVPVYINRKVVFINLTAYHSATIKYDIWYYMNMGHGKRKKG
jgi:hypothetical protein